VVGKVGVDGLEEVERRLGEVAALHVQPHEQVVLGGHFQEPPQVLLAEVLVDELPHHRELDRDAVPLPVIVPLGHRADEVDVGVPGCNRLASVLDVLPELVEGHMEPVLIEVVHDRKGGLERLARHEAAREEEGQFHSEV